jgi:hypothetical protein
MAPFNVPMYLMTPSETMKKGVPVKTYTQGMLFFGTFRTFGGTETLVNNVYTVEDTATINTWFNPAITSDCRIYLCDTGEQWDGLGRPEDIDMRHQYMQIKVKKVGGMP